MPVVALAMIAAAVHVRAATEERKNFFDDPFEQVTSGFPGCPVPEAPLITESEMRAEAHSRAERGTRCYLSGRCRLPNSYLYDKDIIARVKQRILYEGRFADASVWVEGERRWVFLKGCVRNKAQSSALAQLVREVDDVEAVVDELMIGTKGVPKYRTTGMVGR